MSVGRFSLSGFDDGQMYISDSHGTGAHVKVEDDDSLTVQIAGNRTVTVDKLYGPLILWPIRVTPSVDTCEWIIEREYGPHGEYREVIRIPGQLDGDFS